MRATHRDGELVQGSHCIWWKSAAGMNELNDGNSRSRKVGDCVVSGRVKMVCSIPVCGGDAGFYLGKSRRACFPTNPARSQVAGSIICDSSIHVGAHVCRYWPKSHRRG